MRPRLSSLPLLLSSLLLALSCKPHAPQAPAPLTHVDPGLTPADEPEPGPDLGFLEHLDASHTTVIHVGDVVPHLHRALRSPALEAMVRDPIVIAAQGDAPLEIEAIRRSVSEFERFIPAGLMLGADDSAYAVFVRVARIMMLGRLCASAIDAGGPTTASDLPVLQGHLADDLEAVQMPSVVLWARMRGPEEASSVFDSIAGWTARLGPSIEVEAANTSITISLAMDRFFDAQTLTGLLISIGVLTGPDDPMAPRLIQALLSRRGAIALNRYGSALVLELGSARSPSGTPRHVETLGPLFDLGSPEMVMWARWDVRSTRSLAADTMTLLEEWIDTPVGRAMQSTDGDDFIDAILSIEGTMSSMLLRGQARMDVSDHVQIDMIGEAFDTAIPIDQTPLPDFIPADVVWMELDGTSGLGQTLAGTLLEFEDRLERGRLKSIFKNEADPEAAQQAFIDAYYRRFEGFRDLLLDEGPSLFAPGMAYVITRPQSMQGLRLRPRSSAARPPVVERIPIPEMAFIGKPLQMSHARTWLGSMYEQFVRGMFAFNDRKRPRSLRLTAKQDLGLGVPTEVLSLRWINRLIPDLNIEVEPGVILHSFVHGDYLVLSTSTRLSRQILRSDDPPLTLPRASLLSYGRLDGDTSADLVVSVFESARPGDTEFMAPVQALGVFIRGLDEMVWTSWDVGPLRHKAFTLTLTDQ